jgi:hypothetical protein
MITYEATTLIDTAPKVAWAAIVDGPSYADWDSGIALLQGEANAGTKDKIESETSPGKKFPIKITEFDTAQSMVIAVRPVQRCAFVLHASRGRARR